MRKALPIFWRTLADSWRGLLGWTLGVAAALSLYLPLYPSIAGNGQMEQLLSTLPPELVKTLGYENLGTGAGYAQGTFFGLIGFLLLTIAATAWGSAAIAGAEESGRLELALAHGVSRTRYALESALAILVRLVWLGGVGTLLVLAFNSSAELSIEPANVLAGSGALIGLTLLSGAVALAVGALSGRRSFATAAGAGVAVLGYVLNAIANQVEDLEGLRAASPYAWAYQGNPLLDGADWGGLGLLWGVSAAFVVVATLALRRRDIVG